MSKKEYWFEESWVPVGPGSAANLKKESCKHEDYFFDRTFCFCGMMHHYCNDCGEQLEKCDSMKNQGDPDFLAALVDIEALHKNKSSTYGTGEDSFANFTDVGIVTGKPPEYYALLRIVEKCSRAIHQIDAGNPQDVKEYPDIAGLALCCEALRRKRET